MGDAQILFSLTVFSTSIPMLGCIFNFLCIFFRIIIQYLLMCLETGHSLGYVVPVGATIGTHMCAYAFVSVCTHACIWWFAHFDIRWYTHAHA